MSGPAIRRPRRPAWRPPAWCRDLRRSGLSALPLRVRLVAGFVVAIAVVLTAADAFVYWRVSYALDRRLNADLRSQAAALAPLVTPSGTLPVDPVTTRTTGSWQYQVLDGSGRVLASGGGVPLVPLLSPAHSRAAQSRELLANVGDVLPASRRPLRLLAVPLPSKGTGRVLVVAERRDQRDEALRELVGQLALAGLGALVVTAAVGDRLAKAALSPVERYRAQASRIAGGARGVRLDVPETRDDEVTRLGHTLNTMLDALETALERERRFTQDASHELRTPLTLLSTRIQLAQRKPRTPREHEAVLDELGRDVAALAALADQLLDLSTVERPADDTGDVAAAAAEIARGYRPAADVRLVGAPDGALRVRLSEQQLRRVLSNLIGNALTHGRAPVEVRLTTAEAAAVLTVTDHGPGVDPAFLTHAADRFTRADVARGRPGAGLGLALVDSVVQRAGGDLRLCARGVHHRFSSHLTLPCGHGEDGTTASVLLPLR